MEKIKINTDFIKLDSFLKWSGIANMGSEAKFLIKNGMIKVNSEVEIRRGKKIYKGDKVEFNNKVYIIE